MNRTQQEIRLLPDDELVRQLSYAKGQRLYLMMTAMSRMAEAIQQRTLWQIIRGKFDREPFQAVGQHRKWLEETNEFISEADGELARREFERRKVRN